MDLPNEAVKRAAAALRAYDLAAAALVEAQAAYNTCEVSLQHALRGHESDNAHLMEVGTALLEASKQLIACEENYRNADTERTRTRDRLIAALLSQ